MMDVSFLFEHVSDAIVVVDREFRIVRINPSFGRFFGVTERQVVGKRSCDVFRELNFSRCNEACMKIVKKQVEDGRTAEVPDDHCPHFDYVYPEFDEQGRLKEATFILKDAVYLEGAKGRDAATEGDGGKGVMLASIYHDLASPLQVIRACSDVMSMEVNESPETSREVIREMLEASKRNERRLYEMVRTIRMIPSLEEDDVYQPRPVRPDRVIETVCADFRLLLREDASLIWDVPSNLPEVMVEPELLDRVFFNLLDNAVRYIDPGGSIVVSARHEPGDARVTFGVFDDGRAIPPHMQQHLFTKHSVIDHAGQRAETRRDHGWGLYFCRLTVERFGGSIWVESKEGWGTRFSFTLPTAASMEYAGGTEQTAT